MMRKRVATAVSVLRHQGVRAVAKVSLEKAGMWWRHGDPLELGKFVGRPSAFARLDGCRFNLDVPGLSDDLKGQLLSGVHEQPERTLIKKYIDPGLPLVEFGGAIGVVSCVANRLLRRPACHVVVEANPMLVPVLLGNRERNGCRFSVVNRAVAYGPSPIRFHVNENILASSVQSSTEHTLDVPTITLREILELHGFQRCTLVCDIEGAEVELVRHEARTLAGHVEMLIVEVHHRLIGTEQSARTLQTLREIGFREVDRTWESIAMRNTHAAGTGTVCAVAQTDCA
jgi:FkbM family methyltransferase